MSRYDYEAGSQIPIMYRRGPEYWQKGRAPVYSDPERLRQQVPVKKSLLQRIKSGSQWRILVLLALNVGILVFVSTMIDQNKVQELSKTIDGMEIKLSVASSPDEVDRRLVVLNFRQVSKSTHSNLLADFWFESLDALGAIIDSQSQNDILPSYVGDERQFLAKIPLQANSVRTRVVFLETNQSLALGSQEPWILEVSFAKSGDDQ